MYVFVHTDSSGKITVNQMYFNDNEVQYKYFITAKITNQRHLACSLGPHNNHTKPQIGGCFPLIKRTLRSGGKT